MTLPTIRKALNLSQAELDRRAGLPIGTVNQVETGRNQNPTIGVCSAIARALREAGAPGVEIEDLFSSSKVTR